MEYIKVRSAGSEFEIPQLKACDVPRQIRCKDFNSDVDNDFYGIQLGDQVFCACCGGVFHIDELNEWACIDLCTNWVTINENWIDFSGKISVIIGG